MEYTREPRLAVLIDADNVPASSLTDMLEEAAKYGTPTFKRIYADWTKPHVSNWKSKLLENGITPVQQYSYTQGKNSTDSALIIDAMDILYSGRVDGFCIVSSDSDFTRLATRLREAGMKVYGFGEKKTPVPFISACDKFIYLEILRKNTRPEKQPVRKKRASSPKDPSPPPPPPHEFHEDVLHVDHSLVRRLAESIYDVADEEGWASLGALGNMLLRKHPDFDPRNYGFPKLVSLLKGIPEFELDHRQSPKSNSIHVFVRVR